MESRLRLQLPSAGNQQPLLWHPIGRHGRKMKKIFVVLMSFFLGCLLIVTRFLQKRSGDLYHAHAKENWISIILLALTWGTPFFILFGKGHPKKKD
jgi:4-amino-4-deoxy-L-arabinose transferase-like glycosyltransferase